VVGFSNSGNTAECVNIADTLKARGVKYMAIVGNEQSAMAVASDAAIVYTIPAGAEPVGGAPTTSVVAQEMVVNAVINELITRRNYTESDFKFNHPGGSLGKSLK
jgi:arabinose-5-phosphate isomerase